MSRHDDLKHMWSLGLASNIGTASNANGLFYYHRGLENGSPSTPIMVLIHGYPQTNFMWRHLIPLLPPTIPLFIPDIPGYGRSPPLPSGTPHSKTNQSIAILSALSSLLPSPPPPNNQQPSTSSTSNPHPIILVGHDRGARISHRIACPSPSLSLILQNFKISVVGSVFLDIVPTLTQYQSFSTPANAIRSFHWPFLANVEVAVPLIMAQGGDVFCRTCIEQWVGSSVAGRKKFEENDAVAVYAGSFKREETVRSTCDDYRAGGEEDIEEQIADQQTGRKIDGDVLVVYSSDYLGSRYDIEKVWSEWVSGKGRLECVGIGEGVGHFIAEEAPAEAAEAVGGFWERFV